MRHVHAKRIRTSLRVTNAGNVDRSPRARDGLVHAEHHFANYKLGAIKPHTIAITTRFFGVIIA